VELATPAADAASDGADGADGADSGGGGAGVADVVLHAIMYLHCSCRSVLAPLCYG